MKENGGMSVGVSDPILALSPISKRVGGNMVDDVSLNVMSGEKWSRY